MYTPSYTHLIQDFVDLNGSILKVLCIDSHLGSIVYISIHSLLLWQAIPSWPLLWSRFSLWRRWVVRMKHFHRGPSSWRCDMSCRRLFICAMVKSRYIGDGHPTFNRNPYNGYINPYYWVDDHPLLCGNNGSLDPGTYLISLFSRKPTRSSYRLSFPMFPRTELPSPNILNQERLQEIGKTCTQKLIMCIEL